MLLPTSPTGGLARGCHSAYLTTGCVVAAMEQLYRDSTSRTYDITPPTVDASVHTEGVLCRATGHPGGDPY